MDDAKVRSKYELTTVVIFFFTWGFVFLDRLAISFLLPVIQPALNITNTQVGILGFVTTAAYAISAIFFGAVSDKSGLRKRWLLIFTLITAIASGCCALATSYGSLLLLRLIVGIGEGPLFALMMSILVHSSGENKFGRNSGIVNVGVGLLAVTLGPILVTQIVAFATWQVTFLLASIPSFVMVAIIAKFIKEIHVKPASDIENPELGKNTSFGKLLKYRNIPVCILISIFSMAGFWTLALYASLYLVNVAGLTVQQMGFAASAMGILYMVYSFLAPKLSDNLGRKPALIIFYFLCILAPLFMFLFPGTQFSVIAYIIFGGVPGAMTPIFAVCIPMETVEDSLRATAQGTVNGVGELIGGSCFPIAVGKVADLHGLAATMGLGAVFLGIDFILSFFVKESNPHALAKKAKKEIG